MKQNVTNIAELIEGLADDREKLLSGEVEPKVIAEANNNAGKIINAAKLHYEYEHRKYGKEQMVVKFLDVPRAVKDDRNETPRSNRVDITADTPEER